METGVYVIKNFQNGKMYIGSSCDIERRFREHRNNLLNNKHINEHLQSSYNINGKDFIFGILELCNEDQIRIREQHYLDLYKSYNRELGYNKDISAINSSVKMSEESKDKIRQKAIGRIRSQEAIEKTANSNRGQKRTSQSNWAKNNYNPNVLGLKNLSEEGMIKAKEKMSLAGKLRYSNDENVKNANYLMSTEEDGSNYFFRSLHKAAEYYNIDRGGIKYAIDRNQGLLKKLNIVFTFISKEEYFEMK